MTESDSSGRSAAAAPPEPTPNPFAEPPEAFFGGAERGACLEQLRHLAQWSRRVLLVTGPAGIGKTMLHRQLADQLQQRAEVVAFSASLAQDAREVLLAMIRGFGLAAPPDAELPLLRDLLVEHAEARQAAERYCAVLIDDAELLDALSLEQLTDLSRRSPLRVLLFGERRVVPVLERAASELQVGWHEMRLRELTAEEVEEYLAWRMSATDSAAHPFSPRQVRDMARLSRGVPGRLDQMANVLLARLRAGKLSDADSLLPARHRALLAVIVAVLTLTYLLWGDDQEREVPAPAARERIDLPLAQRPPEHAPPRAGGAAEPAPRRAPAAAATPATEPAAETATAEAAGEAAAAGTAAESAAASDGAPASVEPAAAPEPAPATGDEPAAAPEPAAVAEPAPAQPAAAAAADTAAAPEPSPAAAEPGVQGPAWILEQPGDHFTLQLVTFSTRERALEYVDRQDDPQQFALFRLRRGDDILHVVVYGSFASRAAAEAAARRLPASAGRVEPWIRTFSGVQGGVRSALQGP